MFPVLFTSFFLSVRYSVTKFDHTTSAVCFQSPWHFRGDNSRLALLPHGALWWKPRQCKVSTVIGHTVHLHLTVMWLHVLLCRKFREKEGIPFITRLTRSRQHTQKVIFAANKVHEWSNIVYMYVHVRRISFSTCLPQSMAHFKAYTYCYAYVTIIHLWLLLQYGACRLLQNGAPYGFLTGDIHEGTGSSVEFAKLWKCVN